MLCVATKCSLTRLASLPQVAITGDVMYSDPQTQQDLMELHRTFENLTCIAKPLYTESWLRAWLGFLDRNQEYLGLNVTTEEDFIDNLREVIFFSFFVPSLPQCTSLFLSLTVPFLCPFPVRSSLLGLNILF